MRYLLLCLAVARAAPALAQSTYTPRFYQVLGIPPIYQPTLNLLAGTGLVLSPANQAGPHRTDLTFSLGNSGVTAGSYDPASITVDGTGRLTTAVASIKGYAWAGDGSDGACTFDGAAVVCNTTPAGNVYTFATATPNARNCYCTTAVVSGGVTVILANYILYARQSLVNNGTIHNDGNAASGFTGGAATAGGTLRGNVAGASGTITGPVNGNNSTAVNTCLGNTGGAGGTSGVTSGGTGGTCTAPVVTAGSFHTSDCAARGWLCGGTVGITSPSSGGSGGAGAGDGANKGGGGGAPGGAIVLVSPSITNNGTIRSAGGAGGSVAVLMEAGGGGGSGGWVLEVADTFAGAVPIAPGGVHGTGPGNNGVDGNTGQVFQITH